MNIELNFSSPTTNHKKKAIQKLQEFSLLENKIVIPLIPNQGIDSSRKSYAVPGEQYAYQSSKIECSLPFAFELAFAMTVHKAQGRTIPNVILSLSTRPDTLLQMSFSALYVAFSRVKKAENLRIFLHSPVTSVSQALHELLYIQDLEPSTSVRCFYQAFCPNCQWNDQIAYTYYTSISENPNN